MFGMRHGATVLNDVLCYLTSSRNIIPKEDIIKNAVSFNEDDAIISAKAELFKLCKCRFKTC